MIANALPRPLTAGSVDNAILRADGTGGAILQTSGLIVDDAVVPYSVTGDAATDVITATGHIYTANQTVIFSAITGGAGLAANTVYFVRNPSGNTFQLSTTSGGAAINFTTNITAGTVIAIQANVAISQNTTETNSALVLQPKGAGALIADKPDGTSAGGNARGNYAIDLQIQRGTAAQVASGANSVIGGGINNTASGAETVVCGGRGNTASGSSAPDGAAAICGGTNNIASGTFGPFIGGGLSNTASGRGSVVAGGQSNTAGPTVNWPAVVGGYQNQASGETAFIGSGRENGSSGSYSGIPSGYQANASRYGMQAHAAGQFAAQGDAQRARFVMRNKTTTNSAVELFLDGSSTRLTIPSGKVLALTINISGISSTGAAVAHYLRQYALKNVSGTCTEVYAPVTIGTDNAAGTSIALSAYDVGAVEALRVEVTGTASTIWRWVASVDAVEIAFGT
jgi:hypothetical protein